MKKKPTKRTRSNHKVPVKNALIDLLNTQYKRQKERLESSEHPSGWSPIDIRFPEPFPIDRRNPNRFKIWFGLDLRLPLSMYEKGLKECFRSAKNRMMTESRKERYAKEEIREVKALMDKGITRRIQIFKEINPQFAWFNPRKDYLFKPEDERTTKDWDAWAAYNRIGRLLDRAKAKN